MNKWIHLILSLFKGGCNGGGCRQGRRIEQCDCAVAAANQRQEEE